MKTKKPPLMTLKDARISSYRVEDVTPGILHFGIGNFHRAHQSLYLDRLMDLNGDLQWGIIGAGIMEGDKTLRDTLLAQDCCTTIVEESASQSQPHVVSSMRDFLPVGDVEAIIDAIADPRIKIISLTVTEGGYFLDETTGTFDHGHPDIVSDAKAVNAPKTVFGLILAGLSRRRETDHAALTIMSCDNLPHNGVVAKNAVLGLARLQDQELCAWVEANIAFPSGMVDRITPATGDKERARIRDEFGIDDKAPVFCESFAQWVLEDNFSAGRPELERVGVEFTADVAPFEMMKLRILNGGHAAIAYPSALMGYEYVSDAMDDPLIRGYLNTLHKREIIPSVPPVPNTDLAEYAETVVERFSNPRIVDRIDRLCYDGKNRQPKFILPTIRDRLSDGANIDGLALLSALWCRYCQGKTDEGAEISSNDPVWPDLSAAAQAAQSDPMAWLGQSEIYAELGENPHFVTAFKDGLRTVTAVGTREALDRYINNQHP